MLQLKEEAKKKENVETNEERDMKIEKESLCKDFEWQKIERVVFSQSSWSVSWTQRILSEYRRFFTNSGYKHLKVELFNGVDICKWIVKVDILRLITTRGMRSDFDYIKQKTNQEPEIEFEIKFTDTFPYTPPFIRIIRPVMTSKKGFITAGGAFCLKCLSASGWKPSMTVENAFIEVMSIICQGDGRVDLKSTDKRFSYEKAKVAFEDIERTYKWC